MAVLRLALAIGCACACSSSHSEQAGAGGGSLLVYVRSANGVLVQGAKVETAEPSFSATTDETGTVLFDDLPAGSYRITARHSTLGQSTDAVDIEAGAIARLTLALEGVVSDPVRPSGPQAGSAARPSTGGSRAGAPASVRAGTGGRSGAGGALAIPPAGEFIDVATQVETMLLDPEGEYLYALDRVNNSLHFVNLEDEKVETSLFVGSSPVDMDMSDDGLIFVANFGSTEITVVDTAEQKVARTMFVDTSPGTWQGNPYRLALTAEGTLAFTSEDQWNNIKLVDAEDGAHITAVGSVYQPDLVASSDGTRLYIAESGYTGSKLIRFDVSATDLVMADQSVEVSGYGSRLAVMSGDGKYVFYARQKYLADNMKSVLGMFGETICASNEDGSIVIGDKNVLDGKTFSIIRPLPISTTVMALSKDASTLYLYDASTSRIYIEDLSDL